MSKGEKAKQQKKLREGRKVDFTKAKSGVRLDLSQLIAGSSTVPMVRLSDQGARSKVWTSTGNTALDRLCGRPSLDGKTPSGFGIGSGRMYTFYGLSGTAKTLTCLTAAKTAIDAGCLVLYVDMERTLGSDEVINIGLDTTQMLVMPNQAQIQELMADGRTFTLEKACEAISKFCFEARRIYKDLPILVCYDSIAASSTELRDGEEFGKQLPAHLARGLSNCFQQLRPVLSDLDVASIWVNQERVDLSNSFSAGKIQPGGNAAQFYPDSIIYLASGGGVWENPSASGKARGRRLGETVYAYTEKSRMRHDKPTAMFRILYDRGIDDHYSVAEMAANFDLVTKNGSWIDYGGTSQVQGLAKFADLMRADAGLYNEYRDRILAYEESGDEPLRSQIDMLLGRVENTSPLLNQPSTLNPIRRPAPTVPELAPDPAGVPPGDG